MIAKHIIKALFDVSNVGLKMFCLALGVSLIIGNSAYPEIAPIIGFFAIFNLIMGIAANLTKDKVIP